MFCKIPHNRVIPGIPTIARLFSTRSPPKLDFDDTAAIYAQKSTPELIKAYGLTISARIPLVAKFGPAIMEHDPSGLVKMAARLTYFKQFCGGETLEETRPALKELTRLGMRCMLDYSVEGAAGKPLDKVKEIRMDKVAQIIYDSVGFAKRMSPAVSFAVVKVTGIADTNLLERISEILCYAQLKPEYINLVPKVLQIEGYNLPRTLAFNVHLETPPKPLADWELEELERLMNRLNRIAEECEKYAIPIFVDAEQSYYQGAIDQIFMKLSLKFNTKTKLIYNTYQMYLTDSMTRLKYDFDFSKQNGVHFGAKLVRGAYIRTETERYLKLGLQKHPVNNGIEITHQNYKEGVDFCLDHIDTMGVVIASHNKQTVVDAVQKMYETGVDPKDPRVTFAQLFGMGDYLSLTLANNGYNISKYLAFGPIESLMPFFARRLTENSDIAGGSVQETERIRREIQRRLKK